MVDFHKIITAALEEGQSLEDIAKEMTEALNKTQKSQPSPTELYIKELRASLDGLVKSGFTLEDAMNMIVICTYAKHLDWDVTNLKAFKEELARTIRIHEKTFDLANKRGRTGELAANDVLDVIFSEILGTQDCKAEDSRGTKDCSDGSHKSKSKETAGAPSHRSDDEILTSFFKSLGL